MAELVQQAFSLEYNGIANVLMTEVQVSPSFDPRVQSLPSGNTFTCNAIWDTGATNTVITNRVAQECNLKPVGVVNTETASGTRRSNVYFVSIMLPQKTGLANLRVTEGTLNGDLEVLIGMDVIGRGDFAITSRDGKTLFSFRYPSVARIDFVQEINRDNARKQVRGSGKKQPRKKQKRRRK